MIRLNFLVEGQTEEAFVKLILREYLSTLGIVSSVIVVHTNPKKRIKGGGSRYGKIKNDLSKMMKSDSSAWYTTMFDFYGAPTDFPGMGSVDKFQDIYAKAEFLESEFSSDIQSRKFIPYIQLHEFEALMFVDKSSCHRAFPDHQRKVEVLFKGVADFASPEHINNSRETAPSKRLIDYLPYKKTTHGPNIAQKTGLNSLRAKCRHFDKWLGKLEGLAKMTAE